jgi:hypothetical protein
LNLDQIRIRTLLPIQSHRQVRGRSDSI